MKVSRCFSKVIVIVLSGILIFQTPCNIQAATGDIDTEIVASSAQTAKQIEAEGIVLLKNEDKTLPLVKGSQVNIFGCCSLDPYYGSSGSGSVKSDSMIDFYSALKSANITYNDTLYNQYSVWYEKNKKISSSLHVELRSEMPVDQIDWTQARAYSDTAVVMIGRAGSEGSDLTVDKLQLQSEEARLIDKVANTFDKVIVLFNIVNLMEMGFLDNYPTIKAAAIIWSPGEVGLESVAKMLNGEVNPSGRLSDTIAYQVSDHPSSVNFGDFQYTDDDKQAFLEYEENIYVGYRYFETFHVPVQYPFGYGLSYTTFEWNNMSIDVVGNQVTAQIAVTNTGGVAGKDVVQIYASTPYIVGGIEKSSIQLASYVKTDLLQPGETRVYTASFSMLDIASYDETVEQAWVLDEGEYRFIVARNVESTVYQSTYTLAQKQIYRYDSATGTQIKNLFADVSYAGMVYLSREQGEDIASNSTYPTAPTVYTTPVDVSDKDSIQVPVMESGVSSPILGATYDKTITLQDVYRDRSLEEKFLDQLTLDEMTMLIAECGYKTPGIERLGIPETADNDGPASVKGAGGLLYKVSGVAWPAATCLACTWNDSLAWEFGMRCGVEAANIGTDVWYAPGVNIHRNPMGGRNYEYYSEDPVLSGRMATEVVKGAQSQNLIITVKHFALNESETNRMGVMTWCNEQAMRELYLKPFEMTVKQGNANGIMSAYNRLGKTWCGGSRTLLTDLLRTEWGFDGFVVSDYVMYKLVGKEYMSPVQAIYAQNDAMLTALWVVEKSAIQSGIKEQYEKDPVGFGLAMRTCCKNLIHMKMSMFRFNNQVSANKSGKIRIEGETAYVQGNPVKGNLFIESVANASQGFVLCNLSKKGNTIQWQFDVEEAGSYNLSLSLANTNMWGSDVALAGQMTMKINDEAVTLSGVTVKGDGLLTYNVFRNYNVESVILNAGINTITINVVNTATPNIDYIEFVK